ncbi:MAG: hypothetical protein DYH12_29600, partial [Sorangiineae bacterium PRO1]|nr:hypothetical protein [Sorangiineae bacterium PRO1]
MSCSAADEPTETSSPSEPTGEATEFLTGPCTAGNIGQPCDPDGATGPLLECGGICFVGTNSLPACVTLAAAGIKTLDGAACGTVSGIGSGPCANSCLNGACIAVAAKAGAACRPANSLNTNTCSGQCNGTGTCISAVSPCSYGRNGCVVNTCIINATAGSCQALNLLKDTSCNDGNACSLTDTCDGAGKCAPATMKNCDDGNVCTTDTCNPNNGVCLGQPNTNPCDDKNACTTGDTCANGSCQPGTTPTNCDDNNACTTDSCNPATGCAHVAKNCNDNNACTTDSCNTTSGACVNTTVNCDDNDPCTTDACNTTSGCTHTPIAGCADAGSGGTGGASGSGGASGCGGQQSLTLEAARDTYIVNTPPGSNHGTET